MERDPCRVHHVDFYCVSRSTLGDEVCFPRHFAGKVCQHFQHSKSAVTVPYTTPSTFAEKVMVAESIVISRSKLNLLNLMPEEFTLR